MIDRRKFAALLSSLPLVGKSMLAACLKPNCSRFPRSKGCRKCGPSSVIKVGFVAIRAFPRKEFRSPDFSGIHRKAANSVAQMQEPGETRAHECGDITPVQRSVACAYDPSTTSQRCRHPTTLSIF